MKHLHDIEHRGHVRRRGIVADDVRHDILQSAKLIMPPCVSCVQLPPDQICAARAGLAGVTRGINLSLMKASLSKPIGEPVLARLGAKIVREAAAGNPRPSGRCVSQLAQAAA
jgi:hypothetical protein